MSMMCARVGEAIDDGLREPGVGEHLCPLAEGQVGGHDQRAAFVAFGEDLEDELAPAHASLRRAASSRQRRRLRETRCNSPSAPTTSPSAGGASPTSPSCWIAPAAGDAGTALREGIAPHERRATSSPPAPPWPSRSAAASRSSRPRRGSIRARRRGPRTASTPRPRLHHVCFAASHGVVHGVLEADAEVAVVGHARTAA